MDPKDRRRYELPPRPFLYTLDQVADLLVVDLSEIHKKYIYFHGRSTGVKSPKQLAARNIAPDGERPEWRVEEMELIRWFRHTGFTPIPRYSRRMAH